MMADTSVRAFVVEEDLSWRGSRRKIEDIANTDLAPYACGTSSLLSPVRGVAATHFSPIDMVSACTNCMRAFSGERKSDNAGKKPTIGWLTPPISPRSIAIPSASDARLFETDFTLCSATASKATFPTWRSLISSALLKVPLEYQLATACDQNGVHVGCARSREPISHPAQRIAVNELLLIDGDGPAVVSRNRNTRAVGRVRVNRQRGERYQRSSAEK
jgi:hypothetical protein